MTRSLTDVEHGSPILQADGLGRRVFRGASSTLACTVATKAITIPAQLVLAALLLPEDYGLMAIACSVTQIISLVSLGGLGQVLVQRGECFADDAAQSFWLAGGTGLLLYVVMVMAAPWAGALVAEPRIAPLIYIAGLTLPIQSWGVVYTASLYRDLKFGWVAVVQLAQSALVAALAVALAMAGHGPLALVFPQVVAAAAGLAMTRAVSGPRRWQRPDPRRWPAMLAPALWLKLGEAGDAVRKFGVPLVLGLVQGAEFAGLFYWGFTLSAQLVFLFGASLTKVLFPAFTQINADGQRQSRAFASACRLLVALVAPLCVLQAALVDDVLKLLHLAHWMATAEVVRWLSLGMMAEPFAVLSNSVLMARGRFRLVGAIAFVSALGTLGMAVLCASERSLASVAMGAAGCTLLTAGAMLVFAFRTLGGGWAAAMGPAAACCAAAGLAGGIGWTVRECLGPWEPLARVAAVMATICLAYVVLLRLAAPGFLRSLVAQLAHFRAPVDATAGPM